MRLQIDEELVFDSESKKVEKSFDFSKSFIGIPIIYNKEVNKAGQITCSCVYFDEIKNNISYDKLMENINKYNLKPIELDINDNEEISMNDLFTKDELAGQREQLALSRMKTERQVDSRELSNALNDKAHKAKDLLNIALRTLAKKNYFYYLIIIKLENKYLEGLDNPICNSLAVSEQTFYINSDFVLMSTTEELVFLLAHEVSHLILLHCIREKKLEGEHNHTLYNIAADLFINKSLVEEFNLDINNLSKIVDGVKFRSGGVILKNLDIKNENTEKIYERLRISTKRNSLREQLKNLLSLREQILNLLSKNQIKDRKHADQILNNVDELLKNLVNMPYLKEVL